MPGFQGASVGYPAFLRRAEFADIFWASLEPWKTLGFQEDPLSLLFAKQSQS